MRSCDRCGSEGKGVFRVRVEKTETRKSFSFDICGDCYDKTPLRDLESPKGGSRRVRRKVVDPAEVEAAAARRPRKRTVKK